MKNNLRVERACQHMTQQTLAELLGVSRQIVNDLFELEETD